MMHLSGKSFGMMALARHGETDWNRAAIIQGRSDLPLNESGRAQVRELANTLRSTQWDVIISSPLCRASESALILSGELGCSIVKDPSLIERDYGPAEGLSVEVAKILFPIDTYVRGRESSADVGLRGAQTLQRIAVEYPGGHVIVVAHGEVIAESLRSLGLVHDTYIRTGTHILLHYEGVLFSQC